MASRLRTSASGLLWIFLREDSPAGRKRGALFIMSNVFFSDNQSLAGRSTSATNSLASLFGLRYPMRRPTLRQQIAEASHAYIMDVAPNKGCIRRYSVYLLPSRKDKDGNLELDVLWPQQTSEQKDISESQFTRFQDECRDALLSSFVHYESENYPAFHFRFSRYGFSARDEIRRMFKSINPLIVVATINGGSPSTCL